MGPKTAMNNLNSDSSSLAVPKLRDNGSNWANYQPRLQYTMGAKGLWRHVEGTATVPMLYAVNNRILMLSDGKTPATEDQIEAKESKIMEFEKREYLARHILMSTMSTYLGTKIKGLATAEDMWKVVKDDATSKSMLYLLDAEDQLFSMKLAKNEDAKAHLAELKSHFQLMLQHWDNLIKIGSIMSDSWFNTIMMSSLPGSYWPTLQTITASEWVSKLSGIQSTGMKADNLIAFILEEAQHRVINNKWSKLAESALAAHTKKPAKPRGKKRDKTQSNITCDNCKRPGHGKPDCYSKGGGKEGQGPQQWHKSKPKESGTVVVAADNEENEMFAFTCTSDYTAVADDLDVLKSRLGTCVDSGASWDYCPDCSKFTNYKPVDCKITMADGRTPNAVGMDDLQLELPNGKIKTKWSSKMLYMHLKWPLP